MNGFKIVTVCLLLSMLSVVWLVPACFAIGKDEAGQYINQAEQDLGAAYSAVAEAELAGANTSLLKDKLNDAGELLAKANNTFTIGDYESAFSFAMQCSEKLNGVVENATSLKAKVEAAYSGELFWTGVESSFSLSVLFVLSLFSWSFLERRFLKRVLELKPELEEA
jgi:hypothetical protein